MRTLIATLTARMLFATTLSMAGNGDDKAGEGNSVLHFFMTLVEGRLRTYGAGIFVTEDIDRNGPIISEFSSYERWPGSFR